MQISCCPVLFRSYLNWAHFYSGCKASKFWSVLGCQVNTTLRNKHNKLRQTILLDQKARKFLTCSFFLGKCLHSCCLISQLIITIIRFIFVFLWELLRSKHSMVGFVSPNDRGKRLSRPIKGRLAGKWSCAHPHTTRPYIILYIHIYIYFAYIYILLYIACKTNLALYFSLIHLYHRAFWSCIEGASFGQSPVARWQTHPEVRRLQRCATLLKIIDSSSGPWSQPAHIQFCQWMSMIWINMNQYIIATCFLQACCGCQTGRKIQPSCYQWRQC